MATKGEEKFKQYFIAVVPPSPIYEQALELKHYFKQQFKSKASLNSPPHITLHMPFKWAENKEVDLLQRFSAFQAGVPPFSLSLKNFNSFPPRVIFIDVENNEALTKLQKAILQFCKKELNLFNANYKDQPFHPHLTLAFRDLKKSMYTEAWKEFSVKEFSGSFLVDRYVLLKHNGHVWETFKEFVIPDKPLL